MKKILIGFILVGLFSNVSFSQFSFRFYGGMTHVMSNDISSAAKATNELLDIYDPGHIGYFEKLCCGINFGGELFYSISNNFGVGLGIELIRLKNESHLTYDLGVPIVGTTAYTIKVFPVMLSVHYSFPITSLLHAYFSAGAGYYFMNLDHTADSRLNFGDLGTGTQTFTFQSNRGTFGVHLRWGTEIFVSKKISFLVEGTGRLAKYSDIKGEWTNKGNNPTDGIFKEKGSNLYFWYYEESILGKNYAQIVFSENAPAGVVNIRKGEISLFGLSFTAGIKIGLDLKKK
ncbi:hypothetical protein ACFLRX_03060 [Acidobacteriota bacterium]